MAVGRCSGSREGRNRMAGGLAGSRSHVRSVNEDGYGHRARWTSRCSTHKLDRRACASCRKWGGSFTEAWGRWFSGGLSSSTNASVEQCSNLHCTALHRTAVYSWMDACEEDLFVLVSMIFNLYFSLSIRKPKSENRSPDIGGRVLWTTHQAKLQALSSQ